MTGLMSELWGALSVAGGSVALAFIVTLALGICSLAVLFFGSAVVVLERFARAVKRPLSVILVTLVWALLLGALGTDEELLEGMGVPWPGLLQAWLSTAIVAFVFLVVAQGLVAALLRFLAPRSLGFGSVAFLAGGYALAAGGLANFGYSLAPAVVAGATWGLFYVRRRRRGGTERGSDEWLALIATVVLGLGALLPLALPGPSLEVLRVGSAALYAFAAAVLLGLLPLAAAGLVDARGTPEWFIAGRYLFAKRRQTFISIITGICVAGVAVGVWLIVTVISVMNGFERTWREEILGNRAHLTVHNPMGPIEDYPSLLDQIEAVPEVLAASPYVDGEGMIRGERGEIVGVKVRGIDAERVVGVTDLAEDLSPGSKSALTMLGPDEDGIPGIVLGSRLAISAGVGVGDAITIISPFGGPPTPLGPGPRLKRFRVAGVFQTSFFQYDEVFTFTSLAAAQDFRRIGDVVHGIEVKTTDYYRSRRVADNVESALGFPYYTRDWKEFFPSFFQALKTERVMMWVLLTMIMVVATFAIVVTLIMMIMEKSSDVAILKAMGATDAMVERIFAIEGTMIGLLGTVIGLVSGVMVTTQLSWLQEQIEFLTGVDTLPAAIYQFANLPWEIDVFQLALISAMAMVFALGATLLPSRHGAKLDPAESLRYE
jgi:lipoprotein-releasing system permease protein